MRKTAVLCAVVLIGAGCQGDSASDKALDTASPMANVPSPPPPANKKRMSPPASFGSAPTTAAGPRTQ